MNTAGRRPSLTIVDAFTDRPFSGNPAAVCVLAAAADPTWMQAVAAEMNQSETAFLVPLPGGDFSLRWFTPAVEVSLFGHATLASAHVLWEDRYLDPGAAARFQTASGELVAHQRGTGIELDFPLRPVTPVEPPDALLCGLRAAPVTVARDAVNYLVEVPDEATLRGLRPDMDALRHLAEGVIVTSRTEMPGYDFVSRYFAPSWGIPEDPVTGSAHCSLAPYWRERTGNDTFRGYQASARGGTVGVRIAGDRALLRGDAVTVVRGELRR